MKFPAGIACALLASAWPQDVNPHAQLIDDFQKRVSEYVKMRKKLESGLPALKSTASQEKITHREHELAERIRKARHDAPQGSIFTPEIAAEFRRLVGMAMQGPGAVNIRQSLRRAEPVRLHLRVNAKYPARLPLQSTPPTLLLNLPALPPEVDYRVVGNNIILRDVRANLIIDFMSNAIS